MAEEAADTGTDTTTDKQDDLTALRAEMEQMKRELAASRAEKSAESTARSQAEQRALSSEERRIIAEESACKSTIDSFSTEADNIEAEIARLSDEPGHGAEISKLTRRLSTVTAKLHTEEQRQTWLATKREEAKSAASAPVDSGPKLANGAALSGFAPASQQWFRDHPKAFTDASYLKRVVAAANYALDVHGMADGSPEYFEFVEQEVDGRTQPAARQEPEDQGEDLEVRKPQPRAAGPGSMNKAMATIAAPSRSATTSSGTGPRRQAMLSADEREVADKLYGDKFPNQADRYVHYAEMKKYQTDRKRFGFGAN